MIVASGNSIYGLDTNASEQADSEPVYFSHSINEAETSRIYRAACRQKDKQKMAIFNAREYNKHCLQKRIKRKTAPPSVAGALEQIIHKMGQLR